MATSQSSRTIVLLGGGHAHVFVLLAFGRQREPGVRLILVTTDLVATYSGMLPGFVAGHYTLDDCRIDLVRLARFANAELVHASAIGVDRARRQVLVAGLAPIAYDLLSIDVGITPLLDDIAGARDHGLIVKPVSVFADKWQRLEAKALSPDGPRRIAVVGGGAAGVELVLAARHRLTTKGEDIGADRQFTYTLIAGGPILPSHCARARRLARRALSRVGIDILEGDCVLAVSPNSITLASRRVLACDAVLISTKATAPAWFAASGLPCDAGGFLTVRPTLQLTDDDRVFAVGDCAGIVGYPREKSGVYAVRQGPVVASNLRRVARGDDPFAYTPQRRTLSLISLGDQSAIAAWGIFAVAGRWVWRWKDRIDRDFVETFNLKSEPVG